MQRMPALVEELWAAYKSQVKLGFDELSLVLAAADVVVDVAVADAVAAAVAVAVVAVADVGAVVVAVAAAVVVESVVSVGVDVDSVVLVHEERWQTNEVLLAASTTVHVVPPYFEPAQHTMVL